MIPYYALRNLYKYIYLNCQTLKKIQILNLLKDSLSGKAYSCHRVAAHLKINPNVRIVILYYHTLTKIDVLLKF